MYLQQSEVDDSRAGMDGPTDLSLVGPGGLFYGENTSFLTSTSMPFGQLFNSWFNSGWQNSVFISHHSMTGAGLNIRSGVFMYTLSRFGQPKARMRRNEKTAFSIYRKPFLHVSLSSVFCGVFVYAPT